MPSTPEEVNKVINSVIRGVHDIIISIYCYTKKVSYFYTKLFISDGRKVLITTTENNHEFIDAATLDILIENLTTIDQSRDNSKVPGIL